MNIRFFTLALFIALLASHLLALEFFWYWQFAWFDIAMHILGGVCIVFLLFSLRPVYAPVLFTVIALCVGLGWEVFESLIGAAALFGGGDVFDTVTDLLAMFVGVGIGLGALRTMITI